MLHPILLQRVVIVAGVLGSLSCTGGNGELTRETAQQLLEQAAGSVGGPVDVQLWKSIDVFTGERGGDPEDNKRRLHMYENLVGAGVLQRASAERHDDMVGVYVHHEFAPGPTVDAGPGWMNGYVRLTLANPRLVRVIGITQQETQATVLYEWRLQPTETYTKLVGILAQARRDGWNGGYPFDERLDPGIQLIQREPIDTASATFVRFDDGWRIQK